LPNIKKQLKEILIPIKDRIVILYFSQGNEEFLEVTKEILKDIEEINELIQVENHELSSEEAKKYGIIKNGTMIIMNEDRIDKGVYYYGPPAGYEINSFVHSLLDFGGVHQKIPKEIINKIEAIDKDIDIKVFVGLSCPHCPGAVINAHTLAKHNPRIKGIMVEASAYEDLSRKFNISSVPRIIINDGEKDLLGNQPMEEILKAIESI
jgi:glutaredoxin-like protein